MTDTKTVYAEYRGTSQFEIPFDVKDYSIIWNKLTYKDKDGVEHEVEPSADVTEDVELFKRPSDVWCDTDTAYEDEPTDDFTLYFQDEKFDDLVRMLWNRMDIMERKEILDEMKARYPKDEEDEDEEEDEERELANNAFEN